MPSELQNMIMSAEVRTDLTSVPNLFRARVQSSSVLARVDTYKYLRLPINNSIYYILISRLNNNFKICDRLFIFVMLLHFAGDSPRVKFPFFTSHCELSGIMYRGNYIQ